MTEAISISRTITNAICAKLRGIWWCLRLTMLCCLLSWTSYAQLSTGAITGTVRDAGGDVVVGAKVVLTNLDTAVARNTVSNSAGNYLFLDVNAGRYSLETSAVGFKSSRIPQLSLAVSQTLTSDLTLQVGGTEETVTVSAPLAEVESSTSQLGTVIGEKQVVDLPLNGRNFTQLLALTPGVSTVNVSQSTGSWGTISVDTGPYTIPSVNGQRNRSNIFMIDGSFDDSTVVTSYAVPPIIDAIQEFKIVSQSDQAEYGGSVGGIVNVVTKSGTNTLKGTAWEFLRNDAFDARNPFVTGPITPYKQNMFGFSVGGPVYIPKVYNGKDRLFFFGAFQQYLFHTQAASYFIVPTDAEYNGDLSDVPSQIYNPFTTRLDPANPGEFIRDPFPGNQIPTSMYSPAFVAYAKATLPAAQPGLNGAYNAIDKTPTQQSQREYTARADYNLSSRDSIFFRYSSIDNTNKGSGGRPALKNSTNQPAYNLGVNYVHIFGPSLLLQAQYARLHEGYFQTESFPDLSPSTFASMNFNPSFGGDIFGYYIVPGVNVSGYFSGGGVELADPQHTDSNEFKGSISKTAGNHFLKAGAEYTTLHFEEIWVTSTVGFATQQTGNPENAAEPGSSLASLFLNVPDNGLLDSVHTITRPGGVFGGYFQDTWKAIPKLTVNLGLRYDLTLVPPDGTESTIGQHGGIESGDMDFNNGTYIVQKVPPACSVRGYAPCIPGNGTLPAHVVVSPSGKLVQNTYTNVGPRVGLAYRVLNNTVLHAAFGIYFDNFAGFVQTSQNSGGTWPDNASLISSNLNAPTAAQPTPTVTGQFPFNGGAGLLPAANPFGISTYYFDPNMKNPYSEQWHAGIEQQVNDSTIFSIEYVGSGTHRLDVGGIYNTALTPGPGSVQDRNLYNYIVPALYDRWIGKAAYNGLQVSMNKRFDQGFSYQVAYTWSKSLDYCSSEMYAADGIGSNSCQDPYNLKGSRGPSGFDLRQVLTVNTLFDVPIGKGRRFQTGSRLADYVLGNWQWNNIFSARSGIPYQVTVDGDVANTGNSGYMRANIVGNPRPDRVTRAEGLNTAAFAIPQIYTYGNEGKNSLRTDPYWDLDTSLFRIVPLGERRSLEIRAEAFNALNTLILGQPANDLSIASTFGQISAAANNPRILQLGAKITF